MALNSTTYLMYVCTSLYFLFQTLMHFAVDGAQRNMIYETGEAKQQVQLRDNYKHT